jgi:hypothetical protein
MTIRKTGAPYTRDLRNKVYRGRSLLTINDAEDAISILEFPRQELYSPVGDHGIVRLHSWNLMVQGWPADDPVNPSDPAYELLAMVEMRLARLVAEKLRRGAVAASIPTNTSSGRWRRL